MLIKRTEKYTEILKNPCNNPFKYSESADTSSTINQETSTDDDFPNLETNLEQ